MVIAIHNACLCGSVRRLSDLRQGIDAANAAVKPGEIDYITRSRIEATERAEEHQMGKCLVNGWI